jgi:hypothetical protein
LEASWRSRFEKVENDILLEKEQSQAIERARIEAYEEKIQKKKYRKRKRGGIWASR